MFKHEKLPQQIRLNGSNPVVTPRQSVASRPNLAKTAASHHGDYVAPDEAATQLLEEALQPYQEQIDQYHKLTMSDLERDCCLGVILGLYRYAHESAAEFTDWCEDMPENYASAVLTQWRERNHNAAERSCRRPSCRGSSIRDAPRMRTGSSGCRNGF